MDLQLLMKYNVPVPRYTSYPTVPFWHDSTDLNWWQQSFRQQFEQSNQRDGISLYLHLPFCESLCTYCGCNKKITTFHGVETIYLEAIIREWNIYRALMETKPVIREIHLGGGTPTFFSPQNLALLLEAIFETSEIHPDHAFSIEGHPNNTTRDHLETLYALGFRRISYGVQDHDPAVQRIINRIQPFENVQRATDTARDVGFTSVNFDLIYGLPLQNLQTMEHTILQSASLRPDRLAFYSYAHVPWTSRGQRLFDENDLPSPDLKMQLYQRGSQLLNDLNYHNIGMDHFALPDDELYKAWQQRNLHRNFMGYTTQRSSMLLGLGVSAISETAAAYAQNHKTLQQYYKSIGAGIPAVQKSYWLNAEDKIFRKYILEVICNGETVFQHQHRQLLETYSFPEFVQLEADHLIHWNETGLKVTARGHHFLRNICRAFDLHLLRSQEDTATPLFSKAV